MPQISIIMPAYNAEKYIEVAITSIISQTFTDWELIIVDDCSTDNTANIVKSFCQKISKIKFIQRSINSGAARLPRKEAALAATSNLIMTFDADDFLGHNYIERMYNRQKETKADIILSCISFCDETGKELGQHLPKINFNYNIIINGREAAKRTFGELEISVSGLLISKEIYLKNILNAEKITDNCSYADEIDQRKLLMLCNKVAFANAKYYYRQQPGSIMHNTGIKRYDCLTSLEVIYRFAKENFKEREVFQKLDNEFLTNLLFCQRDYYVFEHYKIKEEKIINEKIAKAYKFAKSEQMQPSNIKQRSCMLSYPLFRIISYIYSFYLKNKR